MLANRMEGDLQEGFSLMIATAVPFAGLYVKRLFLAPEKTLHWGYGERTEKEGQKPYQWQPHQAVRSSWAFVFVLMGVASWIVWQSAESCKMATLSYVGLLLATWLAWPPLIPQGGASSGFALDTAVLALLTLTTAISFHQVDRRASVLLVPYIGWTLYAAIMMNTAAGGHEMKVQQDADRLRGQPAGRIYPGSRHMEQRRPAAFPAGNLPSDPGRHDRPNGVTGSSSTQPYSRLPERYNSLRVTPESPGQSPFSTVSPDQVPPEVGAQPNGAPPLLASNTPRTPSSHRSQTLVERIGSQSSGFLGARASGDAFKAMSGLVNRVSGTLSRTSVALAGGVGNLRRMSMTVLLSGDSSALLTGVDGIVRSDTISVNAFSDNGPSGFKIRDKNYLKDKKKYAPTKSAMQFSSVNLITQSKPCFHIARFLPSIRDCQAPFTFAWQVMVPGKQNYSLTWAWSLPYDPVRAVNDALMVIPEDREVSSSQRTTEDGGADQPSVASDPAWQRRTTDGGHNRRTTEETDASMADDIGYRSTTDTELGEPPAGGHRHRRTRSRLEEAAGADLTLFGNRKDAEPEGRKRKPAAQPETPSPYSACNPLDVAIMRMLDESGDPSAVLHRRMSAFKVIPRIPEGSWVVKQAVGSTPVLLGNKLTTQFHRGPRYLEVDVDVGSSRSAAHVVSLVSGALKSLVIELGVVLEGRFWDELPEQMLATVRLEHLDLSTAAHLDAETGHITRKT